jgi:hypothetical protein
MNAASSQPEDDPIPERGLSGVAALAQAALSAPNPPSGSEDRARADAMAQFQEMLLTSRHLHPQPPMPTRGPTRRIVRLLRRLIGK